MSNCFQLIIARDRENIRALVKAINRNKKLYASFIQAKYLHQ